VTIDLTIQPDCPQIVAQCRDRTEGTLAGFSLGQWHEKTRRELGLATDRPIIATGHQSLLWHPGILAKYLLVDAIARLNRVATANLIVDQHAGDYGSFEVPLRRPDGSLGVRRLRLTNVRKDEPMGLHEPFTPPQAPRNLPAAADSVLPGIEQIFDACYAHRDAPNAALQMGLALADLMKPWVRAMPNVTATDLVETSLARAIMKKMVDDPWHCAACYNRAVAAVPEAGIGRLQVRDDYVELPLWRIRDDRRRMHAYDNDVERCLSGDANAPALLPRALFMTALIRLGMCDLFVHGTGGARYDRAMELWIREWLGVKPAPIAIATATLRLDLARDDEEPLDLETELRAARRVWHDPEKEDSTLRATEGAETEGDGTRRLSQAKSDLLATINAQPRRSAARREAFFAMHRRLAEMRDENEQIIDCAQQRADVARRQTDEAPIISRRDWPFRLYPEAAIDALAEAIHQRVAPCAADPRMS